MGNADQIRAAHAALDIRIKAIAAAPSLMQLPQAAKAVADLSQIVGHLIDLVESLEPFADE